MKQYPHNRLTTLAALFATCAVLGACGGGGGDSADKSSSQAVTPTAQPAEVAASAAEAASSAASAATAVAEAASAAASTAAAAEAATGETVKAAAGTEKAPTTASTKPVTTPATTTTTTTVPQTSSPAQTTTTAPATVVATAPVSVPVDGASTATTTAASGSATTATPAKSAATAAPAYNIGVYYYPGWSYNLRGSPITYPWVPIQKYPEREPMLGWYEDSSPTVLRQQADMMRAGGLDFVVFDSYWDQVGAYMDQALRAYKSIWKTGDPKFAMIWANHFVWTGGRPSFDKMLDSWIAQFLSHPGYLNIDGKPALFVFSVEEFQNTATTLGLTVAQMTAAIQTKARAAGLPGVYLVGGTPALEHWVKGVAVTAGFNALTAYNYHIGYSGDASTASAQPNNYSDLTANYAQNWQWIFSKSTLPYITPMTSGWDSSPWLVAGSGQTTQRSIAASTSFETHLRAAKAAIDSQPAKSMKMGIVCCWNEFGEGSFIEPTKAKGTQVIDQVKKVFKTP